MSNISDKEIKSARKEYHCHACYLILQIFSSFERFIDDFQDIITEEEINDLKKAEQQGFKILKGDSYRKVFFIDDNNEPCTFNGLLEIDKICQKYDIYEEQ